MKCLEAAWWAAGLQVAGIDEAGRGALAGPVVAAAVVLPPAPNYPFRDSKTLSAAQRQTLEALVMQVALGYALGQAEASEVDTLGVLAATHLAAQRALQALPVVPQALLTDYLRLSTVLPLQAPPKADRDSPTVAAASILAKQERDRLMEQWHQVYPSYGFAQHKGYGTAQHLNALRRWGPCPQHRRSFAPVAQPSLL